MSRRWRYPRSRRGVFYGPIQPSVAPSAPSYTPVFQEPSGRSSRLAAMRSRRGLFFPTIRLDSPPARSRRYVVRLASARRGKFFTVPVTVVVQSAAVWIPAQLDPARRKTPRPTRRGQFFTVPLVGAAPVVAPWVPPNLDPARRKSARTTRRGEFFPFPLAPLAAPPPGFVPPFMRGRRPYVGPRRRGAFQPVPPMRPPCPSRPASRRPTPQPRRRSRIWTPPIASARWIPRPVASRRPAFRITARTAFSEPGWVGLAPVPPGNFVLYGRVRPNQLLGAVRPDQIHGDVRPNQITGNVRPNQIIGGNSVDRTLSPGSAEVVWAEVTFLGLTAAAISAVTAQIAFSSTDTPGTWQAPDATTREDLPGLDAAKLSVSKSITAVLQPGETVSTYRIWAKLNDGTIVPCEQYTVR